MLSLREARVLSDPVGLFQGLNRREPLAEGVEQLLALAVRLEFDRTGPGCRIGRAMDGGLTDLGLPSSGGCNSLTEQVGGLRIIADQGGEAADCVVEARTTGPVGFKAAVASGQQIAA
ncbi:hypothetical protein GOFOIKOB_5802 [Methylobacterium tardum]|nr:hypothetical protein GOFOIKOB_5802 [Methylobacterium tardum]